MGGGIQPTRSPSAAGVVRVRVRDGASNHDTAQPAAPNRNNVIARLKGLFSACFGRASRSQSRQAAIAPALPVVPALGVPIKVALGVPVATAVGVPARRAVNAAAEDLVPMALTPEQVQNKVNAWMDAATEALSAQVLPQLPQQRARAVANPRKKALEAAENAADDVLWDITGRNVNMRNMVAAMQNGGYTTQKIPARDQLLAILQSNPIRATSRINNDLAAAYQYLRAGNDMPEGGIKAFKDYFAARCARVFDGKLDSRIISFMRTVVEGWQPPQ